MEEKISRECYLYMVRANQTLKLKALIVLCCALGFAGSAACHEAALPERVLDQIVLNETKIDGYLDSIVARGCSVIQVESTRKYSFGVLPGCFNLVGHPTVLFSTDPFSGVITSVLFAFEEGSRTYLFDRYFDHLTKIYGQPTGYTRLPHGILYARWNTRSLQITLEWPPGLKTGTLTYKPTNAN